MQFITKGPHVPERLIQSHEEGRVVFFCGAGISYPARLPGFGGLVDRIYGDVGESPSVLEKSAIKAGKYDTAIGLLEARIAPDSRGRELVRTAVSRILTSADVSTKSTATHAALLALARSRNGQTRLVTTNFDRLFEEVIQRDGIRANVLHAPLLPVPKNRWDGLVYLHGLLAPTPNARDLDRLVLSSGDFGLAYLTERWAARFVSELFRNYTVCFVGYSINDPVLRYMMDALAADRLLGESPPEMFAFGSHAKGKEEVQEAEWCAKNVTPILYREHHHHLYLHRTLHAWASTYRDGVGGKEQIIVQYANSQPQHSTKEEDFVGRVLWALSDKSGLPALRFADVVPPPPFGWIESFVEPRFGHDDLARFGVAPLTLREELQALKPFNINKLEFSLLDRPAPYLRAPYMAVVRRGAAETLPDDVMRHLARWLLRYLDEPKLILWLARHGADLPDFLADSIERRLSDIGEWEREVGGTKIDELRRQSPQAIPRALLRPIWHLLLTGRVRAGRGSSFDLYQWFDRFRRDGLTASLRLSLRELLAPRITLREPFRVIEEDDQGTDAERLKLLLDWELVLSTDHVHSLLRERNIEGWNDALPALVDEFTMLLRDALDIMAELGTARTESDLSYLFQPSITDHEQNRDFYDWTALIELARDAWLATAERDPHQALSIATKWWAFDYPLFRRLTFFAATRADVVQAEQAIGWLLSSNGWWLWSTETEREAMQLLSSLAPRLDAAQRMRLSQAIQAGPPREMFRDDVEEDRWNAIVDREVWQRLAKLHVAGMPLDLEAQARLDDIAARHREWPLAANEQDEFPVWMGQNDDWRRFETTPRRRQDLMQWLREHPDDDVWEEDDWAERCRKDFATTSCALFALAREDFWPTARWQRALHAWSDGRLRRVSWKRFAPFFAAAPDWVIFDLSHGIGGWLQAVSKLFELHAEAFFTLCERVLSLCDGNAEDTANPVTAAINHPVGYVTQALLDWWYRRDLQNDQGLPPEIEPIFTRLCDTHRADFRHGRVLLAAHAINLFLIDRRWFDQNLLPLFDWHCSNAEARAAWEGFFWSPRLVRSHLAAIKPALLETAHHYDEIGEHARQYAAFLTYASLDRGDTFSVEELREALRALPEEGLAEVASALARGIEGAGEQRDSYWTRRVAPFWKDIWPKTVNPSPAIADDLFRLCIAAGSSFPAALATIRSWLVPVPYPSYLLHRLLGTDLCRQFPETSLEWLHRLIDHPQGPMWDLRKCLQQISQSSPALAHDQRFQELDQLCRQYGC
ncbi:anti-phage defense-associated sirtuin Dsr1 [Stenotrophomonas bentonitica]|uniref:anti-phage defense-associated sirtuin Dsr1 n=1 Tax=Stenotrophomonas bentonitica TaxID=1450134 RepID=UPI00345E9FEA